MSREPRWRVRRSLVSGGLTVLGALLFALGLVQLWATDTIFNTDRFAGAAVTAVEHPTVRAELSRVLVDQTIAYRQDLITVRPLLETVADGVIASPPFRRLIVTAAADLHRSLFTTEQPTLLLDLSDATVVLIGGLRAFDPSLAERVPENLEAGLISFGDRNLAAEIVDLAQGVRRLAWVLLAAGVAALAAAVAVSSERRRASIGIGASLTIAALFLWLLVVLGRDMVTGGIAAPGAAAAAGVAYDTYAESLIGWLWVVGLAGVAIAATATATVNAEQQRDWLARTSRNLTRPPSTRGRRVLYTLAGVLLGVFFLAQPGEILALAARAGGALLLYFSSAELLRLSGLVRPATARAPAPSERRAAVSTRLAAGMALGGLVVLAALTLWLNGGALRSDTVAEAQEIADIEECNGHAELCDRRLNEVVFAATHNSMSSARESGWFFASHDGGIPAQLKAGIRGLLIDTHYGFAGNGGVSTDLSNAAVRAKVEATLDPEMIAAAQRITARRTGVPRGAKAEVFLCHGFCELGVTPLDRALGQVRDFLEDEPHEVLILFVEDYVTPADMEAAFIRSRLIDYVYTYTPGQPFPTLREMIERGERIVVLSENAGSAPAPPWYHDGFALVQETPFSFKAAADFSCRPNRGRPDSPLFQLNHWIEKLTPSPGDSASVNAYAALLARARQCQQERGRLPNIIAVNFYAAGDVIDVVDTLNRVAPERPPGKR